MTAVVPPDEDAGLAWVIKRLGASPIYWSARYGWGPVDRADSYDGNDVRAGLITLPTDGRWARVHVAELVFGF